MANVTLFHYIPGQSSLHKADPRFKIAMMLLLSLAVMSARNYHWLGILSIVTAVAFGSSRLPLRRLVGEGRPVIFFGCVLLLIYSWTAPGKVPITRFLPGLTWQGLTLGLLFIWKFFLVFLGGLIFTGTTTSQNICDAVEALLKPVPFLPAARLATMIGLIFVLTPLLLDQTVEMMEAQASRGILSNKNPLDRIRCLVIPLSTRIIHRAEQLALAMEARGYSEQRTPPVFHAKLSDWLGLFLMIGLWVGMLF